MKSIDITTLIFLTLLSSCAKKEGEKEGEKEALVTVQTVAARRAKVSRIVSAEAVLFPLHAAALSPKISAPVRELYVNRGDHVHKGQLLAVLENRDLAGSALENKGIHTQAEADYKRATASTFPQETQKAQLDLRNAKETVDAQQKLYDSRKELFEQGALARRQLDEAAVALTLARSQYEIADKQLKALESVGREQALKSAGGQLTAAEGKYAAARAQLEYSEVKSPIDGVVTDRPVYAGEFATAGTPFITVMDIASVVARAHIPQPDAALLKNGDAVSIAVPGMDTPFSGKVALISPALDANSTTVEVWIQAANPGSQLRPGTTVHVSMVAKVVPNALVVPAAALLTKPDGKRSVMVVGTDGKAHEKEVEIGVQEGGLVEIASGLKDGEQVVSGGAYGLPDGAKVVVEKVPAEP